MNDSSHNAFDEIRRIKDEARERLLHKNTLMEWKNLSEHRTYADSIIEMCVDHIEEQWDSWQNSTEYGKTEKVKMVLPHFVIYRLMESSMKSELCWDITQTPIGLERILTSFGVWVTRLLAHFEQLSETEYALLVSRVIQRMDG